MINYISGSATILTAIIGYSAAADNRIAFPAGLYYTHGMRKFVLLALLFCLLTTFASAALLKDDQTLSVTGSGFVQVPPDTANVKLGVEVLKKSAPEAQADNAALLQKVMAAVGKLGIAADQVQTAGFNLWPENKYEPNQPAKLAGYRCSSQLNITVGDLGLAAKVIDAGIGAGATTVQGIQFTRKDDTEFKKMALAKAVKEAAGKAAAIALAAGLKLKQIKNITESGALPENAVRAMSSAAETPVSPGLLEIRGNVTITYKVE